jgi:hypothetical protein
VWWYIHIILATPGGRQEKSEFETRLGKVSETISEKKKRLGVVTQACNPSYLGS